MGEVFDLAGVGVLGGVDLPQALVAGGGLVVAAGGRLAAVAGSGGGEQGGAVGAEDAVAKNSRMAARRCVFADGDGAGVARGRCGGGWRGRGGRRSRCSRAGSSSR